MSTSDLIDIGTSQRVRTTKSRLQPWAITLLLSAFLFINFADKAVLGLVAKPLSEEFGLDHAAYGHLASAFYLLFSVAAFLVGMLTNRISTRWLLLILALLWSLTQVPMIWTTSIAVVYASRIALGAAEGPAFGLASHAVHKWFDNAHLQLPNSVVAVGAKLGSLVAAPMLTWVIVQFGWRQAFVAVAIAGLIWSLLWLAVGREGPITSVHQEPADREGDTAADAEERKVPYRQLLLSRTYLGQLILSCAGYFGLALAVTWLPSFLQEGLHRSLTTTGSLVAVYWGVAALLTFGAGLVSQRMTLRGISTRWSRGAVGAAMILVGGVSISLAAVVQTPTSSFALVALGMGAPSAVFAISATIQGEITPMRQRGTVLGLTVGVATLSGVIAPSVMGVLVQADLGSLAGYQNGFKVLGAICMLAAILGFALINPARDAARLLGSR
ncbi:MFS transporter [Rhodococcus pseudokoreensis]|uniref:MFS transporter n=1 Tax=Rhodococcus pseudokoreensis TaxID=2811421 RepID=A0A974W9R2_9NOCA|nr:MFS transporter [Rhodococcus pseudokoreensis]QSE93750.1 MFS transporter [Rhodococcus pseudokoreensis]